MAPASQPQWAGIEQDKFPHDSVASFEHGPVRTEFVDRPHPLLFGRIVWVVGNLFDLVDPTQGRLYVLAMLLLGHHPQLSVRTQARRRNRSNLSVEDCLRHDRYDLLLQNKRHDGKPGKAAAHRSPKQRSLPEDKGQCAESGTSHQRDWAMRDSNPRHPACKAGALTN